MPQKSGWIKFHRSAVFHPVLRNTNAFNVFARILLEAAWKPEERIVKVARQNVKINLDRGETWISQRYFDDIGINRTALRTALKRLQNAGMIAVASATPIFACRVGVPQTSKNRTANYKRFLRFGFIVSVCNYDKFQEYSKVEKEKSDSTVPQTSENRTANGLAHYNERARVKNLDSKNLTQSLYQTQSQTPESLVQNLYQTLSQTLESHVIETLNLIQTQSKTLEINKIINTKNLIRANSAENESRAKMEAMIADLQSAQKKISESFFNFNFKYKIDRHQRTEQFRLFETWWKCWTMPGTKRGKIESYRAWLDTVGIGLVSHDRACREVRNYLDHCRIQGISPEKITRPANWLKRGCWDDHIPNDLDEEELKRLDELPINWDAPGWKRF